MPGVANEEKNVYYVKKTRVGNRTEYIKAMNKAKNNFWRNNCECIEEIPEGVKLQKILKISDGGHIDTRKELLLRRHFPGLMELRAEDIQRTNVPVFMSPKRQNLSSSTIARHRLVGLDVLLNVRARRLTVCQGCHTST